MVQRWNAACAGLAVIRAATPKAKPGANRRARELKLDADDGCFIDIWILVKLITQEFLSDSSFSGKPKLAAQIGRVQWDAASGAFRLAGAENHWRA